MSNNETKNETKTQSNTIADATQQVMTMATVGAAHDVKDEARQKIAAAILDGIDKAIDAAFSVPVIVSQEQIKAMHVMAMARGIQGVWNARMVNAHLLPQRGGRR